MRSRSPPPRNGSFVKKRKKKERKKGEKPISLKLEGATGCKALTHLRYEDVTSRHASRLPRHLTFRLPTVLSPRFEIGENDEKLRYAGGWGKKKRKKKEKGRKKIARTHFHGNSELLYYANSITSCSFLHTAALHGIIAATATIERGFHPYLCGEMKGFKKERKKKKR